MQSKRRNVRKKVLQVLYAYELTKDPVEKIKQDLLSGTQEKDGLEFANKLIDLTLAEREKYDKLITNTAENWELDRIALLDHIIIRMCLCEFYFFEDIPPKVSINEAIELAKLFSTRNSGKFVNGILDSLLIKLKENGEIKKKGKGLKEF